MGDAVEKQTSAFYPPELVSQPEVLTSQKQLLIVPSLYPVSPPRRAEKSPPVTSPVE